MKRHLVSALAAATLSLAVPAGLIAIATTAPAATSTWAELPPLDPAAMKAAISGPPDQTVTGALVKVTGPAGRWSGTSGVGDVTTRRRVIGPLGLRSTYVLDRRDPRLPGPHAHGYVAVAPGVLRDVSAQSPYPWAEGGLISSADDLTRFIRAIFKGRLVPPAELGEMFTVPDVPYADTSNCDIGPEAGRACYSAGLMRAVLPNGVTAWGKTGSRPGYTSGMFATRDLRRVLVYSLNPTGDKDGSEMPYVMKIAAATFDPDLAGR